jgi:ribosome-associated translation inhibitor RaiA
MTKITFSNYEQLKPEEREYAHKQVNSFLEKNKPLIREIDSLDIGLSEKRRRLGKFGLSEINLKIVCNYGVFQSNSSNWNKRKALKESLNKLEKQIKKKR